MVAVLPLGIRGISGGDDLRFHLLSWMEVARQFSAGNFHPQWAFTPGWNAGEPRFIFYPPLSWVLGALLGLLFEHVLPAIAGGWAAVPVVFCWIALTASGLTMYRLARSFASPSASLVAASIYLLNPYMLLDAYHRGAFAELLAAAWIPLLFHSILSKQPRILTVAVPVALLWLTNAPAAVMCSYALAFLAAIRLILLWRDTHDSRVCFHLASRVVVGVILGLGAAAFYIVPAAYQQRFVKIELAQSIGSRIEDSFIFHFHGMGLTSWVAVTQIGVMLTVVFITYYLVALPEILRRRQTNGSLASRTAHSTKIVLHSLLALCLLITFLMFPRSIFLWYYLPELRFIQFTWRLLAIAGVILGLAIAILFDRLGSKTQSVLFRPALCSGLVVVAALMSYSANALFYRPCDPDSYVFSDRSALYPSPAARLAIFNGTAPGPEGTGSMSIVEYTPRTADNDLQSRTNPPFWIVATENPNAPAPPDAVSGPAPLHITLASHGNELLVLNLHNYPLWHVMQNGRTTPIQPLRKDGLIAFPLEGGNNTIDLHLSHTPTEAPDQFLGAILSLVSLATILVSFCAIAISRRKAQKQSAPSRQMLPHA
jgi:hypothetical protein